MSNFRVGQKIVCVDDQCHGWTAYGSKPRGDLHGLKAGEVYTIRAIIPEHDTGLSIVLEEIRRPVTPGVWHLEGYNPSRFRPVAEKPTAMDVIRSIVLDPSKPIPADPREPVITPVPEYDGYEVRI